MKSAEIGLLPIVVAYLAVGALAVRKWRDFQESGKTFLFLVFPAHSLLYLLFADCDRKQVWAGIKHVLAILLVILFLVLFARWSG